MTTLRIDINIDNDAFGEVPGDEACRILKDYANLIGFLGDLPNKTLKDINGNTVGSATVIDFPSEGAA